MKKIYTSLLFILCFHVIFAQDKTVEIDYPIVINGDITIKGRDYVRFLPGFSYKALITPERTLTAKIDESMVCNMTDHTPINPDTRQLSTSLPVGATAGSINVSPTGAATYTIPVMVPPGTAGMQPNLSVTYNSQSGIGLLGLGWSLGGLSSITRVPQTIYNDGKVEGGNLTRDDRFALDGNRLVLTNGAVYGAGGTEYRTEIETFSKILAVGTAGTGPQSFTVQTKDGRTITYGGTNDSRIILDGKSEVLVWNVSKVEDAKGNFIRFTYHNDNTKGEFYPSSIEYTGNTSAGLSPYNKVDFFYETKPDKSTSYVEGAPINQNVVLYKIRTVNEGEIVREYEFKYTVNFYTKLNEIIEYGSDGSRFNSTFINWGENTTSYENVVTSNTFGSARFRAGDFNGDGKTDFIKMPYRYEGDYNTNDKWELYLVQPMGDNFSYNSSGNYPNLFKNIYIVDVDNDGDDDMLIRSREQYTYNCNCQPCEEDPHKPPPPPDCEVCDQCSYWRETFKFYYFNGSSMVRGDENFDINIANGDENGIFIPGDFNGDGRMNYLFLKGDKNFDRISGIYAYPKPDFNAPDDVRVIDFNGNGKNDIMVIDENTCKIYEYDQDTYGFNLLYNSGFPTKWHDIYDGDFNGDGKTDVLTYVIDSHSWGLQFSTGTGYLWPSVIPPLNTADPNYSETNNNYIFSDFNGDGKTDILEYLIQGGTEYMNVFYSIGDGTFRKETNIDLSVGFITSQETVGDFNGDGKSEILKYNNNHPLEIQRFHPDEESNMVHSILNGLNVQQQIYYTPITNTFNSFYEKGSGATFPVMDFQGPLYAVSSTRTSDGMGGIHQINYFYKGAKIHRQGKGFLGFTEVTTSDFITGIKEINYYEYHPAFFNLSLKRSESWENSNLTKEIVYTNQVKEYSNKRIFPHIQQSVANDLVKNILITSDFVYDDYGNLTTKTSDHHGEGTKTTSLVYGTFGSWCPSKITQKILTQKIGSEPAYSSTTGYTYYGDGLLKNEITEEGVTTTYTYNALGNMETIQTVYPDLETRSITLEYDSFGRFNTKKTDALDHFSETQYDSRYGTVNLEKNSNGLITRHVYDGFGRLKETLLPNGQKITQHLGWTGGTGPQYAVYYTSVSGNGNPEEKEYFDRLGRSLRQETNGFDGSKILTDTEYNIHGHVARTSLPYFEGQAVQWTTYQYDNLNRVSSVVTPANTSVYGYNDRETTVTNTYTGQSSTKTIDAFGNLKTATDAAGLTVNYQYHSSGQPKTITTEGSTVSMEYDQFGNQTRLTDPDAGTIHYTYYSDGSLHTQSRPGGTITLTYDKLGRTKTRSDGAETITYTYDNQINGKGKISSVVSSNGPSLTYAYDSQSRINELTEYIEPGHSYTTRYSYDTYGRLSRLIYPGNFAVDHIYNGNGYLAQVKRADNGNSIWTAESLNAFNQLTRYRSGNDLVTVKEYTSLGFLQKIQTGAVQHLSYVFNPASGNLESRSDVKYGLTETFGYDDLDRLVSTNFGSALSLSYNYDNSGNITYKHDAGNYGYEAVQPHAVTSVTNDEGTISPEEQNIMYNIYDDIIAIDEGTYYMHFTYGPEQNRRKMQLTNNTTVELTRYYAENFEEEVTTAGSRKLHYIFGGDGLAAIYELQGSTGNMYYVHKDHLGSIMSLTDENGNIAQVNGVKQEFSFDAWGRKRNPSTWSYTDIPESHILARGFTGHEHLDMFGLVHMNGRVYDPVLGRFLSPDNYVQMPDFSQNFNRYSYALNNPLVYVDPDGENPFFVLMAGMALFTAGSVIKENAIQHGNKGWYTFGSILQMGGVMAMSAPIASAIGAQFGANLILAEGFNGVSISYELLRAGVHGLSQAMMSPFSGSSFSSSFLSGGIGSFAASASGGLKLNNGWRTAATITTAGITGGISSELSGGKFFKGALRGTLIASFNHVIHDHPPTEEELYPEIGNQVMKPKETVLGKIWGTIQSRVYTDERGVNWFVGANGKIIHIAPTMGMPDLLGGPLSKGQKAIKLGKYLFNPRAFHATKQALLKSLGPKSFAHIVGQNPDIMIKGTTIFLTGAKNSPYFGKSYKTTLSIFDFISLF